MRTVGLIPARGGSKRLPRKNVRWLAGKPLVFWTVEAAIHSKLDAVYVSTEDQEVYDIVRDFVPVLHRPAGLAGDHTPSEAVIIHALHSIDCDRLMLLQPTSPLRTAQHINEALVYDTCVSVNWRMERNGAIYLMRSDAPMEFDYLYEMDGPSSIDIDTEADFALAERLLGAVVPA